jgi:hypothetical protein
MFSLITREKDWVIFGIFFSTLNSLGAVNGYMEQRNIIPENLVFVQREFISGCGKNIDASAKSPALTER